MRAGMRRIRLLRTRAQYPPRAVAAMSKEASMRRMALLPGEYGRERAVTPEM